MFYFLQGHLDRNQHTVRSAIFGNKPTQTARVWVEHQRLSTPNVGSLQAGLCLGQYASAIGIMNEQGGKQGEVVWRREGHGLGKGAAGRAAFSHILDSIRREM